MHDPDAQALADVLCRELPLSRAMGVAVASASPELVRLALPLNGNVNHQGTAFGGSLSAAGMLAGWGLIWLRARRLDPAPRLVIAESQTRFIRPAHADFEAICDWPRPDAWEVAAAQLARHGRCRLSLRTEIRCGEQVVAAHDGDFALLAGG